MNSVKILHAVRSAITAIAELLVLHTIGQLATIPGLWMYQSVLYSVRGQSVAAVHTWSGSTSVCSAVAVLALQINAPKPLWSSRLFIPIRSRSPSISTGKFHQASQISDFQAFRHSEVILFIVTSDIFVSSCQNWGCRAKNWGCNCTPCSNVEPCPSLTTLDSGLLWPVTRDQLPWKSCVIMLIKSRFLNKSQSSQCSLRTNSYW